MRWLCASNRFHIFCALFTLALLTACATDDSDGIGGDTDGQEVGRDLNGPGNDLGAGPDAGGGDTGGSGDQGGGEDQGTPDLGGDDTSEQPDITTPACGALSEPCCDGSCDGALVCESNVCVATTVSCEGEPACITPVTSTASVTIVQQSGAAPTLTGGTIVEGDYELDRIELYTDATVSILVDTFEITNNGGTNGAIVFEGTDWGFEADLDLFINASAIGQNVAQAVSQSLDAGGCYSVVGNQLQGDLLECGASWPEGSEPPESLGYEVTDGGIDLLLVLTRAMILAAIPEEDRTLAGFAIEGDLPVLLSFSAAP